MAKTSLTAAVLLYQGCTIAEVIELATRLRRANVDMKFVAVDGSPLRDQSGIQVVPDVTIAEVDPAAIDVLIAPGGDPEVLMGNDAARDLVGAVASTAVVAGICAGVLVLADAGVLDGRRATHNYRAPWAPPQIQQHVATLFERCIVEPDVTVGVVIDGRVITALPNATIEFAVAVLNALDLVATDRAELLMRHLRGEYVADLFTG